MTTPEPDPARRARDEFADTGVVPSSSAAATAGERAGDVIDRYRLLQEIGEGGMGTVWMAEQKEPVRRQVALKIIKLGMDTKEVVVRFEAERQALALMDHPNIAKVLDGGATAQGRPFFVMELVRGVPITQYCDEQKLGIRARLELFTKVCEAIQHAHHKGVIHRDIKPSNVMVTLHDGTPVPKVIDFGIAKATSVELTQKTLFTQYGNMIGTPEYMAPEQAAMSGLDIDTRADVYSLGVLLYELLTGSKPFDITKVLEKGYAELLRTIREDDPAKPSTRVSTLGDKTPLALSHANVGKLSSRLRGDLDWIVMRALEKDRTRRYETANGFAADVARYLNGEPVHAAPPSSIYKLRKFVARRKRTVALLAVIVVLLVGGTVGTTLGWMEAASANTKLAAEVVEKEKQRELAEAAKVEAQTQQQRAEQQEAEAKKQEAIAREQETEAKQQAAIAEAVAKFQTDMLAAVDPSQLPVDPVTKEPLKDALTVVQAMAAAVRVLDEGSLRDQPLVEARVRQSIGRTLLALARHTEAEPNLRKALTLRRTALPAGHPDIASSLTDLALLLRDRDELAKAEPLYREALEIVRAAAPAGNPEIATAASNLGELLHAQNNLGEAEPLFREALDIERSALPANHPQIATSMGNLALLLRDQNKLAEAAALFREALVIYRAALPGGHPLIATGMINLASVLQNQNEHYEAESLLRQALEVRRAVLPAGHPGIAAPLHALGALLLARNDLAEAEPLIREAMTIRRAALPAGHLFIASALDTFAELLQLQNRFAEAEPLYRESLEIRRAAFPAGHPDIAISINNLARLLNAEGKLAEAEPLYREALQILRATLPAGHRNIAAGMSNLARLLHAQNRLAEAEPLSRQALEIQRAALPAEHPDIAASLLIFAAILQAQGKLAEAEPLHREALAIHRAARPAGHPDIATSLLNIAVLLQSRGEYAEAEPPCREALEIDRAAFPAGHPMIATCLGHLSSILALQGKLTEAEALLREALQIRRSALPAGHADIALTLRNLAEVLRVQNKIAEAEQLLREALAIARASLPVAHRTRLELLDELIRLQQLQGDADEEVLALKEFLHERRAVLHKDSPELAGQLVFLGMKLLQRKAPDEAAALLRECLEIREKVQPEAWTTFNTRSLLGEAYLGQNELAEAEPLLLDGYQGMKEREADIPAVAATRIPEALERLVKLYEAKGDDTEAAAWRSKLEAARSSRADK